MFTWETNDKAKRSDYKSRQNNSRAEQIKALRLSLFSSAPAPSPAIAGSPSGKSGPSKEDIELRNKYEDLIAAGNEHPDNLEQNLYEIRKLVLLHGLPPESTDVRNISNTHLPLTFGMFTFLG
jgi:hypothetical protein